MIHAELGVAGVLEARIVETFATTSKMCIVAAVALLLGAVACAVALFVAGKTADVVDSGYFRGGVSGREQTNSIVVSANRGGAGLKPLGRIVG